MVIDYIEEYAFTYAKEKGYLKNKKEDDSDIKNTRIQSKELFHMVAGTSSSAILAGFLVRPSDDRNN